MTTTISGRVGGAFLRQHDSDDIGQKRGVFSRHDNNYIGQKRGGVLKTT